MADIARNKRLGIANTPWLTALPAATVLPVPALMKALGNPGLQFASLAASALLISLDHQHAVNKACRCNRRQRMLRCLKAGRQSLAWLPGAVH